MSFATQSAIEEFKRQQMIAQQQRMDLAYIQQALQEQKQKEAYDLMRGGATSTLGHYAPTAPSGGADLSSLSGLRMGWGAGAPQIDAGDESDGGSQGASDNDLDSDDDDDTPQYR